MLEKSELDQLLNELGTPPAGRRLITKARKDAPVREVKSTGSNVITLLSSAKMARAIATESRTAEYNAALTHELNAQVLAYYPQPCTLKLELIDKETGEIHAIDHTPDFLVIERQVLRLQEWKTETKLLHLARRFPWRYQRRGDRWCSPQIEEQLADLGIAYEIHSASEFSANRIKNLETLRDYLMVGAPSCSLMLRERIQAELAERPGLSMRELTDSPYHFNTDELLLAIAAGVVACRLDTALLSNPDDFILYRDEAVMFFAESAQPTAVAELDGYAMQLAVGTCFEYNHQTLEIVLLGGADVTCKLLNEEQSQSVTLTRDWFLVALREGKLKLVHSSAGPVMDLAPLVRHTEKSLERAQQLARIVDEPFDPARARVSERSYYRLRAQQNMAMQRGGHPILALVPRHADKGNRKSRLSDEQIAVMERVQRDYYSTPIAPNGRAAHRVLEVECSKLGLSCPSYPTFMRFLAASETDNTRRSRYGKRIAYQQQQLYYSLAYDTPRHGVRPFECVHVDHTQMDIQLKSRRTGKVLGKPWLTLMVDAYSRRVMAFHVGFMPPDRSAVLMVLRDFVKRWQRLPQMLMTDNGKDLVSRDVQHFLISMGVDVRLRPAGQPRTGSVMERLFGTMNTQLLHNLEGNTELMRKARQVAGSHLPRRLAHWNLDSLYRVLHFWAYEFYDQAPHGTLDTSPRAAFERAIEQTGVRPHRLIAFNRDFVIATCPSVDRGGVRTVDRQRGVKVRGFYYISPRFDSLLLAGKKLIVRYDPYDIGHVFVQLPDRDWVEAHCMRLRHLPRMNARQLEAVSAEYAAEHRTHQPPSAQRLLKFIATMRPGSDVLQQSECLAESEFLHEKLGLLRGDEPAGAPPPRPKVFGLHGLGEWARAAASAHAPRFKATRRAPSRLSPAPRPERARPQPDEDYGEMK